MSHAAPVNTTNTLCNAVAIEVDKAKEAFLDKHLRNLLPATLYKWAKEKTHTKEVVRYLERHEITICELPDGIDLLVKGAPVAKWRMRLKPLKQQLHEERAETPQG